MAIPQYLVDWYLRYCPAPAVDINQIESGTKNVIDPGTAPASSSITSSCQYWIKGLPAPCKNWDGTTMFCKYEISSDIVGDTPTGYGIGYCDGLGRRMWCTKYEPQEGYTDDDYACVLPSIERSGSGKQERAVKEYVSLRPWKPEEIRGYNADGSGVGQCDGKGMGRGAAGQDKTTVEELRKLFPICKHYKPHMMGFGALIPRPFHSSPQTPAQYAWKQGTTYLPETLEQLHDGSPADPLKLMEKRLPYAFKVYNLRAQFQKCVHWDDDYGSDFYIDEIGADPSLFNIVLDVDTTEKCTCPSSACTPYKTLSDEYDENMPWIISDIWAKSDSIVCNGAKPECPCYTGKWLYCIDKNMADGMRITANQIMELRFWTSNWSSQDEYDRYFEEKPGPTQVGFADETTADIYTFTHWVTLDPIDVNASKMFGKKHHMCMPSPLNAKSFNPDDYITIEEVGYPRVSEYQGTHAPGEVAFPTLVRELIDGIDILPDINVIYPYNTVDPWNVELCSSNEELLGYCIHANNKMSGNPAIDVVGSTVRDKDIIVMNITTLGESITNNTATRLIMEYVRVRLMPEQIRPLFYEAVDDLIEKYDVADTRSIIYTTSDEYGYFIAEGLELANNKFNDIFIFCRHNTSEFGGIYSYRYRKVLSRYYGALITQTSFYQKHDSESGGNTLLDYYTPTATIQGKVEPINGNVQDVHQVYSFRSKGIYEDKNMYGYCINTYEVEEEDVIQWTQVGATNYIYVELDDLRVTYLFDFEVEEAYLTLSLDGDGNFSGSGSLHLCDSEQADLSSIKINLEHVSTANRNNLPPSALLLRAETPMSFFNEDWLLYIKYKYSYLEATRGEDVAFPDFSNGSGNYFVEPAYTVNHVEDAKDFSVTGIRSGSVPIMAKISDEFGRVQACAATKMLLYGHRLNCRNVDIFYSYEADAQGYSLEPSIGWPTWIGPPKALIDRRVHRRTPPCGDHMCLSSACIGPMWYPYSRCNTIYFYDEYSGPNFCTQIITEALPNVNAMGTGGWRWGTVDKYKAWVYESFNWLASCAANYYYFYSEASNDIRFTGWAKKRTKIDVYEYILNEWELPPFGNNGRNLLERWIFRDYAGFLDMSGGIPESSAEYMPMVFDIVDLTQDLNCLLPLYGSATIGFFPMMSTLLGTHNTESIPKDQYRFDDIIDLVYQAGSTYPDTVITAPDTFADVVVRYGFKFEDIAWAWPERWKSLERAVNEQSLSFLSLSYPDYIFDYVKKEHRFTLDEAEYDIVFIPPNLPSSDEEDSDSSRYASISINNSFPRYFDIMYDNYTSGYVDWKDEAVSGEEGSSGGEDGGTVGSIYENANNGAGLNGLGATSEPIWMHDFNTIFGPDSEAVPSEDRKLVITVTDNGFGGTPKAYYGYYNRGLIAKIPKSTLYKLPVEEASIAEDTIYEEDDGSLTYHYSMIDSDYTAPTELIILGQWGYKAAEVLDGEDILYSKPAVKVAERYLDEIADGEEDNTSFPEDNIIEQISASSGLRAKNSDNEADVVDFKITISLSRFPTRMNRKVGYFQVNIAPYVALGSMEGLSIYSVQAVVGKYTMFIERVKCWERFYRISTQEIGEAINADGPETKTYRKSALSGKNAGQYFPADSNTVFENGGTAISKTTIINSSKVYTEDEDIDVDYGNLKDIEKNAQAELYMETYDLEDYDSITFIGVVPPIIEGFLEYIAVANSVFKPSQCTLANYKVPWTKEYHHLQLNQDGDFFQPGGHFYEWGPDTTRVQCVTGGPLENVYDAEYHHHNHGGDAQPAMWTGYVYTGWSKYGETEDGSFIGYFPSILANIDATELWDTSSVSLDLVSLTQEITGGL